LAFLATQTGYFNRLSDPVFLSYIYQMLPRY
jgi:hypothetical protein